MATATLSSASIDLRSKDSYPIRLGASILKPKEAKKLTSVRYNHVPVFNASSDVQSSIKSSKDGSQEQLLLKDGSDEYKYAGKNASTANRYVLLCKESSDKKEFVLEKLESCHEFNLIKTPTSTDAERLAAKFPQLSFQEDDDDGLFGNGEDVEEPIDPDNPWDYRNYLKASISRPKESQAPARENGRSTPQTQSRPASSTPVSRQVKRSEGPLVAQKKRRAVDTSKPNPKRVKAGTEPPPPAPKPATSNPKTDLPEFQVEHRRVAQRKASADDSGELILELTTPVTEKPPKQPSAMALALSGQLGQGPISLHSAASSPASRVASPNPQRPEGMEEGEEFDLGGSSSPEAALKSPPRQRGDYFGEDDADADVEDFELPSPAQTHSRKKSVGVLNAAGGGDDDDDLEAQMMAALDEDDDAAYAAPVSRPAESDEESEEE